MDVKNVWDFPAYRVSEAAHYLLIPEATLRSWVAGRPYPTRTGGRFWQRIITPSQTKPILLSFLNLVEAHVLSSIRKQHKVDFYKVRKAVAFLEKTYKTKHPLASQEMETDGKDLFVRKYGALVNASGEGQMAMKEVLELYLKRITRDNHGIPVKLYPFVRDHVSIELQEPRFIVIDPRVSFGRPTIAGTGVPTAVVAERYKAGESIEEMAADYGIRAEKIHEAIRCELSAA